MHACSPASGSHRRGAEASQTNEEPPPLAIPEQIEPEPEPDILELAYTGGYTLWLDCARRGAIRFQYNAQRDQGAFPRSSHFYLDSDIPEYCQQHEIGAMSEHDDVLKRFAQAEGRVERLIDVLPKERLAEVARLLDDPDRPERH